MLVPLTVVGMQVVVVEKLELDPDCDAGTSVDIDGMVNEVNPTGTALVLGTNGKKTVTGAFTDIASGRPGGRSPRKDDNVAATATWVVRVPVTVDKCGASVPYP